MAAAPAHPLSALLRHAAGCCPSRPRPLEARPASRRATEGAATSSHGGGPLPGRERSQFEQAHRIASEPRQVRAPASRARAVRAAQGAVGARSRLRGRRPARRPSPARPREGTPTRWLPTSAGPTRPCPRRRSYRAAGATPRPTAASRRRGPLPAGRRLRPPRSGPGGHGHSAGGSVSAVRRSTLRARHERRARPRLSPPERTRRRPPSSAARAGSSATTPQLAIRWREVVACRPAGSGSARGDARPAPWEPGGRRPPLPRRPPPSSWRARRWQSRRAGSAPDRALSWETGRSGTRRREASRPS
jgi:hypothetical protein